jgi:hypothetical protein
MFGGNTFGGGSYDGGSYGGGSYGGGSGDGAFGGGLFGSGPFGGLAGSGGATGTGGAAWFGSFPGAGVWYRAPQPAVVSGAYGDVNGDRVPDHVFLTAVQQDPTSPYMQQITLHVRDGATGATYSVELDSEGNAGYNPTVFLGDFTGNGIQDILITIDSGGSGAFTFDYIFSFAGNQARKLFDFNEYNRQNTYTVTYQNNYRVKVTSPATGLTYLIDISGRDRDYVSQIYNADGTLKQPVQGWADGVSGFYPVDIDRNGVYEIQAYQQLSGLYHADSLGYMVNTLSWDGRKFAIQQQWLGIFGTSAS